MFPLVEIPSSIPIDYTCGILSHCNELCFSFQVRLGLRGGSKEKNKKGLGFGGLFSRKKESLPEPPIMPPAGKFESN